MKSQHVWDYDLDDMEFQKILSGEMSRGKLNQDWAARRLIEYATYPEIVRQIGYARLVKNWPRWRRGIRSVSRRRGLDFLVDWLPRHHPELIHE